MALADGTGLYRIRGEEAALLYIGISDNFGRRWREHAKQQPWWDEMRSLSVDEWFALRSDAEAAEDAAIKAEGPRYNQKLIIPPSPRGAASDCLHVTRADWLPGKPLVSFDTATLGFRWVGGTFRPKPPGASATW